MKLNLHLASLALAFSVTVSPVVAQSSANYKLGDKLPQTKSATASAYKEIGWDDLVPKGWDPAKDFKDLNLSKMNDGDPRAMEALQRMRDAWDNAPVEPTWNGKKIRIPGFIVPLESAQGKVQEFLLVPYFGSCIHSPPPPANQTIHVTLSKPSKDAQMMAAVWITGTLQTSNTKTVFGNSGYKMKADELLPYKNPPK